MEKEKEIHGWRNRSQDKKYQKVNTVQRRIFVSFLAKYKITSVVNTIYILLYICYIYYIICKVYIYIYIYHIRTQYKLENKSSNNYKILQYTTFSK